MPLIYGRLFFSKVSLVPYYLLSVFRQNRSRQNLEMFYWNALDSRDVRMSNCFRYPERQIVKSYKCKTITMIFSIEYFLDIKYGHLTPKSKYT